MSEIVVENIEPEPVDVVSGPGAPSTFAERLVERGDGDFVEPPPEPPALERQSVSFATSSGDVAFEAKQRRGRPKAKAKEAAPKNAGGRQRWPSLPSQSLPPSRPRRSHSMSTP